MFLKAELAELLLPSIFVNLAGRMDLDIDLQQLVSLQVFFFPPFLLELFMIIIISFISFSLLIPLRLNSD